MVRARGPAAWLVAVTSAALLAGCSDEPDPPELIGASSIDGDLTPIEDFEPTAWPVCDIESDTVLTDVDPDNFRAWTRTVGGHEERVVVGIWRIEEDKVKRQFERFVDARQACSDKGRAGGFVLDLSSAGNAPTYGFTARGLTSEAPYRLDHTYTWAEGTDHGYLATVWLERYDGSQVSGDLDAIMDDQLQQIPGY
ncbi:hypothetical protein [Nocardioides sp. WS12]|uniref:hypothetical protein n=1 Tax=Nocardioides sp. WS12 TaxID=2486272 RepID=UPI0015FB9A93|nr:hypothetical protein [Nocardioides sp. WS12]